MKLSKTFILLTLIFFLAKSYGQNNQGEIRGFIINSDKEPAAFSTVVLMNSDSVFMNGALVGEDGFFKIGPLKAGKYHIMVRSIEYSTYISDLIHNSGSETIDLDTIQLLSKLNSLDEVVVKGEKALVEVHADKMVYNISASVNATGNNALELIGKSPGVRVDMDNNIILQGKSGVQIYINGRPSRISGSDLSNMLEGMQSENIEAIEIISNPSAKYDAEGTGGIINIILKKNIVTGLNGSISGGYSKGVKPRAYVGTNMNYSSEKLSFVSSINYSDDNYTFDRDEIMLREDYSLQMDALGPTNRKGINATSGLDYKINNEQTLSVDAKALINDRNSPGSSNTLIEDLNNVLPAEILMAETLEKRESENYSGNLHYSFVPNRSSEFTVDVSYGQYINNENSKQPNRYYSLDSILLRSINSQYTTTTNIDLFSAQMDYKHSMGKTTLDAGAKYSYINTDNKLVFYNVVNNVPLYDNDKSNNFTYLEKIASAYALFSWKPIDKISVKTGLRVENTSSLGELVSSNPGPDDLVPRNYTSLFPNISMAYDDQKNHAISFSFSRRITRPDYQSLNPFEWKLSELSSWKGNPFLKPNFITNYQMNYSFKQKLVVSNTYSITNNYFANIFETTGDKGNVIIPRNMDKAYVNGLSISYPLRATDWWEFSTFLQYNYESYSGNIEGILINLDAHIVNFRMQNNLKLPLDFKMELSGYAEGPSVWRGTTVIDANYNIDLGIKKEFFNKTLLLQVSGRDLFNTGSLYHYSSDYGGMIIEGDAFFDGRRIYANATYKFGNQDIKSRKNKSSLDKEMERISD